MGPGGYGDAARYLGQVGPRQGPLRPAGMVAEHRDVVHALISAGGTGAGGNLVSGARR